MKIYYKNGAPIIISERFCKWFGKFLFGVDFKAMAAFPFIIVINKSYVDNEEYIRHELIHHKQHIENLYVFYYLIYAFEFLYGLFILKRRGNDLYYYISLEQEAHLHDLDENYLKNRKWFSSFKYLFDRNKIKITLKDGKRIVCSEKMF